MVATLLGASALCHFGGVSLAAVDDDPALVPGGVLLSTVGPGSEVEVWRVTAPAGSSLTVDLRPLDRSGFRPVLLGATLGEVDLPVPAASSSGTTKAKFTFSVDGELELRIGSDGVATGDYSLKTKFKAARKTLFFGTVNGEGSALVDLFAPASATATLTAKRGSDSTLVPRFTSLDGPDGGALPASSKESATAVAWKKVPMAASGPWALEVDGEGDTTGTFSGLVKWKVARGANRDNRGTVVPVGPSGPYTTFLVAPPTETSPLGAILSGTVTFGAAGSVTSSLNTFVPLPDAGSPIGFTLQAVPLSGNTGTIVPEGDGYALTLDLGIGSSLEIDLDVAASGTVMLPVQRAPEDPAAPLGLFLAQGDDPTPASLAGNWFYLVFDAGEEATGSIEFGTMSLGSGGTVSGLGSGMSITVDENGTPVPGTPTPLLRTGTVSVDGEGQVTFSTVANLFGPTETWTAGSVLLSDILVGRGPDNDPAASLRLFLRQGTGLGTADASGEYLHFGVNLGTSIAARSGMLTFDGAGAFTGTETVIDLSGGSGGGTDVATAGTYTINSQGLATFTQDGGATGNGIVGPEARYLFTLAIGAEGLSVDFLLATE